MGGEEGGGEMKGSLRELQRRFDEQGAAAGKMEKAAARAVSEYRARPSWLPWRRIAEAVRALTRHLGGTDREPQARV